MPPRDNGEVLNDEIYIPVPINISGLGIPGIHVPRQRDIVLDDVNNLLGEGKVCTKKQGGQNDRS